jgi:hypothetical protein
MNPKILASSPHKERNQVYSPPLLLLLLMLFLFLSGHKLWISPKSIAATASPEPSDLLNMLLATKL